MIDVLFVDEWVILAATASMFSLTAAMNLSTLPKTAPITFIPQEHHTTKTDLFQGINITPPEGTDHTPPIMVPDMRDISPNHNSSAIPTVTGAAVSEGMHCIPYPATAAACVSLSLMEIPITICTVTHPTGIVTSHPTLATSHSAVTQATIPQT